MESELPVPTKLTSLLLIPSSVCQVVAFSEVLTSHLHHSYFFIPQFAFHFPASYMLSKTLQLQKLSLLLLQRGLEFHGSEGVREFYTYTYEA